MLVKAIENFTFYNDDPIKAYKGQIFDMDEDAAEFYISEGRVEAIESESNNSGNNDNGDYADLPSLNP